MAYPDSIPGRILQAGASGALSIVASDYILGELARVLPRLKRLSLSPSEAAEVADHLRHEFEIVAPAAASDSRLLDPADQSVLGTWTAARADYLITGDSDLVALADQYPILTPAAFWAAHGH